jgi:diguanylate cyclase
LKHSADFAARWYGGEFIAVLPRTPQKGAVEIAEQIKLFIEEMSIPVPPDGSESKVTVSIGINTWPDGTECTMSEFISKAETALYRAKSKGRNSICTS